MPCGIFIWARRTFEKLKLSKTNNVKKIYLPKPLFALKNCMDKRFKCKS